jgi:hypothetical protein
VPQGLSDTIDEDLVVEQKVDLFEGGIPELVRVGEEYFHEAALLVRSPHHGGSGEGHPQRVHRVRCAAALRARSRRFPTIAHRPLDHQRITAHSNRISGEQPAQVRAALPRIHTGK